VLVLRALGLGDLLTGLPALRALRAHFPRHELVLAAPERFREVVEQIECVDRLLPTGSDDRGLPPTLSWPGAPPDLAVNLHGSGPQSLELLKTVGAPKLYSFGADGPSWDAEEHERARWCRLLRWYGIPADAEDFLLRPRGAAPRPYGPRRVVLHPGADAAARRWPAERFGQLAGRLKKAGTDVIVTAGRGEGTRARLIAADAGLGADAVLGGDSDLTFQTLVDIVGSAHALVCGDTGVAHLAVSLATPSVTLFGPVSPALWGPPPGTRHVALWHPDADSGLRPGDPGAALPDERLLRISVDEVFDALADVLEQGL
jgi:ADP-heptose:LPS heptosyltransferase